MVWIDISVALSKQHQSDLLAEVERYRLVKQVLAQQRQTGILALLSRTRWRCRKCHTSEAVLPPTSGEKQAMRMLIPYYPARDQALIGKN